MAEIRDLKGRLQRLEADNAILRDRLAEAERVIARDLRREGDLTNGARRHRDGR